MNYPIAPSDIGKGDIKTFPATFVISRLAIHAPFPPMPFLYPSLSVSVDYQKRFSGFIERNRGIVSVHIASLTYDV